MTQKIRPTDNRPQTAPSSAAPRRATPAPTRRPDPGPLPVPPVTAPPNLLDPPTWGQRLIPKTLREVMSGLGWWQDPHPQIPSIHLTQTLEALNRYGWCRSLDVAPTGRMCIRGGMSMLEKHGHVTPAGRARAEHYLQEVLAQNGIRMPFFAWNDLPERTFPQVTNLLTAASYRARANGE